MKHLFIEDDNWQQKKLMDLCELSIGVQAYDTYSGQTEETIKKRIYHSSFKSDETFLPELNGRDINRYSVQWNGDAWISFGKWLAHPRQRKFFYRKRIVIREITTKKPYSIIGSIVEDYQISYQSIINIILKEELKTPKFEYLLAIINSSLMTWYFELTSNKVVTNTFPRISLVDLKDFPIKVMYDSKYAEIVEIVEKILALKKLLRMKALSHWKNVSTV